MKKKATGYILYLLCKIACVSASMVSTVCKIYGMILNKIILNVIKCHGKKKSQ